MVRMEGKELILKEGESLYLKWKVGEGMKGVEGKKVGLVGVMM